MCRRCGRFFVPAEVHYTLCTECFEEHGPRKNMQALSVERDAYTRGEKEGRKLGFERGYQQGYEAAVQAAEGLDQRFWRRVLLLCHPDRHPAERRSEANEVTAVITGILRGDRLREGGGVR